MSAPVSDPPLSRLRSDLAALRRRRAAVRIGTAAAIGGILLVAGGLCVFGLDYLADLSPIQRAIALIAVAVVIGWAARRFLIPRLRVRESETDVALLVERRQGLEGDLVAALQFQSFGAKSWGSSQLEGAVVGYVDEASRDLAVLDGFSWKPLPARLAALGLLLIAVVVAASLFPGYTASFLRRLALSDVPYPTRTIIAGIEVNGTAIKTAGGAITAPADAPLNFAVTIEGERPASGEIAIEGAGGRTILSLTPEALSKKYVGGLAALTEPISFLVRLGDATTKPRRIELVPRPTIAIDLKATPPEYARANAPAAPPPGVRTAFVLEGSDVEVAVRAANKPLGRVTLSAGERSFPLVPSADRKTWILDPEGTSLSGVREPIEFVIAAVDEEGLSPSEPVKGSIRLRADRPPRVAAGAVVRRVVPTGRPELTYGAADDYAVKSITAKTTIRRADGSVEEKFVPLSISAAGANEVQGRHRLDLASFGLSKGDAVVVTVEAEDARGDQPGETASAEPIAFEVTDREGLIASLLETDEEGAERLDEIIRRELGIGGEQ